MQRISIASFIWLGALACGGTEASTEPGTLEVRHSGHPVSGNSFQCTGTWPSATTPCNYPQALEMSSDKLTLGLYPVPLHAASTFIVLTFEADDTVRAIAAVEQWDNPAAIPIVPTTQVLHGWIDPAAMGSTTDPRSSGSLSLTFPWGTLSGTYDTESPR